MARHSANSTSPAACALLPHSFACTILAVRARSSRRSPNPVVKVKQEVDDSLPPSRVTVPPPLQKQRERELNHTPPSTSASPNPSKKRRMTMPGINTDVRRPSVDNGISPVVMGFTIREDDPKALEQVRSMINIKQQQQALIEQRRGSTAGILPPATAPPDVNIVNVLPPGEERQASSSTKPARTGRRSPNPPGPRRSIIASSAAAPTQAMSTRPHSPPPPTPSHNSRPPPQQAHAQHPPQHHHAGRPVTDSPPTQTHLHPSSTANALTAAPISFARRRASRQIGGVKGKPADIVISPRTSVNESHLQPAIQSAPPISRTSSGPGGSVGRFPFMALPSIPPVMAPGQSAKRYANGQVPPTPTRLGMPRHITATAVGPAGVRSPPTASVPIASSLVPPTPASLHHPGYTGEKSAFLAPFEMFYDALADSKHLKMWLSEQLQKSSALIATLERQQAHFEETVAAVVEKKTSTMHEDVYNLRVRVDELEAQLRNARAQGYSPNMPPAKGKGKPNGYQSASSHGAPVAPESYTFPPVDSHVRRPEPRRGSSPPASERSYPNSQAPSPVPFDGRRLSVSAARLESRPQNASQSSAGPSGSHLPPRELPPHNFPPPPLGHSGTGKGNWSPRGPMSNTRASSSHTTLVDRPPLVRQASGHGPSETDDDRRGPPPHLLERRGSVPSALGHRGPPRAGSPMEEA